MNQALSFVPLQEAIVFYGISKYFLMKWHKDGYIQIKRSKKNEISFEIDAGIPSRIKCTKKQKKLCKKENCDICSERSFENHPKAEFWSEKNQTNQTNQKNPRDFLKSSSKWVWFNCNICPHEFQSTLNNITAGTWCPYCCNPPLKLCEDDCEHCEKNSFASQPKAEFWSERNNKSVQPRDVFKSSSKEYWFNCNICFHEFETKLFHITNGHWCPHCCNPPQKVCDDECEHCEKNSFASQPKAIFWSEKNENIKPRDVLKSSGEKYWFNCTLGHEFKSSLNSITTNGTWCPGCKNKTEQILYEWLTKNYPSDHIIKQFKTSWCKNLETKQKRCLPFDFLIEGLNVIIELDGAQHFTQIMNWKDPVKTRERDIYKMNQALLNGYSVIRLLQEDVWLDKNNWETNLRSAIQGPKARADRSEAPGLSGLILPKIIYICENNEYSVYPPLDKK